MEVGPFQQLREERERLAALRGDKVLVFPGQHLDGEVHVEFAGRFGDLEVHPFLEANEERPELVRFEKTPEFGGYENAWHSDVSWRYVNGVFVSHIEGMDPDESFALLERLYRQATPPEFQFRHHWHDGDVVFWDNRAVQHYASSDYWPATRIMERASIIGDRPV